ncbi:tripartite tricarboxylate transporter permease [Halocatena halophila]|uniref:tripartite tricarboxylate transporter permease n=1 Tax=Halocatena halophila TaxID=2814576 RepID=UPI002ED4ED30
MVVSQAVVFAPEQTLTVIAYVLAGCLGGCLSGLIPGIHANTIAFVLAGIAPDLPGPPVCVGAAVLATGVVHTFLDIAPALALGVPDPSMAATALPGHRLVLAGRGKEALLLSALGSASAVAVAAVLAVPLTWLVSSVLPVFESNRRFAFALIILALLATESMPFGTAGGLLSVVSSGGLGLLVLPLDPTGIVSVGGVLMPLFAGLFGAPVLLESLGGHGYGPQQQAEISLSPRAVGGFGIIGSLCGAVVGYVPGVSSAVAATLALVAVPRRYGSRGFIVTTSGVNTANCIFALFALVALGEPRTGVLVALGRTNAPIQLGLLACTIGIGAAFGFVAVVTVGPAYLDVIGSIEQTLLTLVVLFVLCLLTLILTGGVGVVIFLVSAIIGLVPGRFHVKRAHLMGVLLVPLLVNG